MYDAWARGTWQPDWVLCMHPAHRKRRKSVVGLGALHLLERDAKQRQHRPHGRLGGEALVEVIVPESVAAVRICQGVHLHIA